MGRNVRKGGGSITISTSDSLDIDNTYIETPTVTATPVNITLETCGKEKIASRSVRFSVMGVQGRGQGR